MFYQGQMVGLNFTNIQVNGAVYLWEERNPGGAYAQGVVATGLSGAGTWICPNLGIVDKGKMKDTLANLLL